MNNIAVAVTFDIGVSIADHDQLTFILHSSQFFSSKYVIMVAMFFVVQVINNYALNFDVPMPLHMIFRSVSMII